MAIALLDTNAVSDMMSHHPQFKARADAYLGTILTCSIVRGEIRYGIERLPVGKKRADLETRSQNAFAILHCEAVSQQVADVYGGIKTSLEARGMNLQDNDLWIAATALALGATLIPRDKMFQHVPGLRVEDWTV